MSKQDYINELRNGDIRRLSKLISLAESRKEDDRLLVLEILEQFPRNRDTVRIGITGAPGAGKSTFINAFGMRLLESGQAKRLAVLSIDPSSSLSGGSILGDKTRMEDLSRSSHAYIRPSASGDALGGLARSSRLSLLLCEAAGFDTVLVESVGVGQAETEIAQLTDLFLLVLNPGGGDELQGIKRGVVEMADLLLVNKSDGNRQELAQQTVKDYGLAQHLLPPTDSGWKPPVLSCSSLEGTGLDEVAASVRAFYAELGTPGIRQKRAMQERYWYQKVLQDLIADHLALRSEEPSDERFQNDLPERLAWEMSKNLFD